MKQKRPSAVSCQKLHNRIPLWSQLLVLTTLITTILISFLLFRDYRKNRDSLMERQISTSSRILELEMQSLEQYIRDLASFALQPIYDTDLSSAIGQKSALTSAQQTYIKTQMRTYYYTRSDLHSYEVYFCNQGETYGRRGTAQHITLLPDNGITDEEGFAQSGIGKYYNAIMPSENEDVFFCYYQSIISIGSQKQDAVVRIETDLSYALSLNGEHENAGEFICILNKDGSLLYSGNTLISADSVDVLSAVAGISDSASATLTLGDGEYLCVKSCGDTYDLQLLSCFPMDMIHEELAVILRENLLFGVAIWLAAALLMILLLRLLTRPLTRLSAQMEQAGSGNFSPVEDVSGSLEVANLADSFNDMVGHIDRLIREKYLAEIGEKTSRLTALEAQLNPHFLYNTLQAIGAEALLNDQPQINQMITSLAVNLRYSIKGGDLVELHSEMTYVQNYIFLQKLRLEDRLQVSIDSDEELGAYLVPKISIQTLVENSIIHGMGPEADSISIRIRTKLSGEFLIISVEDDGCGIPLDQLTQMQTDFQDFLKPGTVGKIGLANLYSRLRLLYPDEAKMEIQSAPGKGTRITITLPARELSSPANF